MNRMKPLFLALIMLTASLAGCLGGETEILDEDGDGIADDLDLCPGTIDQMVDADGCGERQLDDDGDGLMNDRDRCPNTPQGETAVQIGGFSNIIGCSQSQIDDDGDGVMNDAELCPSTPAGETEAGSGCDRYQEDGQGE